MAKKIPRKLSRVTKGVVASISTLAIAYLVARAPVLLDLNRANQGLAGIAVAMVLVAGGMWAYDVFKRGRFLE